jgi:membrane fusion protein, multidrug efflux system
MKKVKSYLIVAGTLGLLLSVKLLFFPNGKKAGIRKDLKNSAYPVSVYVVGKEALEEKLYANGTLVPFESAEIRTEASGILTYLNVPEGKMVPEGTLLAKSSDSELRAQLEKVKVQIRFAKETEARHQQLYKANGLSKEEYDLSRSALALLVADSNHIAAQLHKTEVRAPFTGILGIKNVSKGSYVTPSVVITQLQQTHPIKLEFSVPEKYAHFFKKGEQVVFRIEGLTHKHKAIIALKDPIVDSQSRGVRFQAHASNASNELLSGSFAQVELSLGSKPKAVFVPTDAIIPTLKGKKLYVIANSKAQERRVETGLRTEDYIQVLSGVEVGDSVIVDGNTQLKLGATLKVLKSKEL